MYLHPVLNACVAELMGAAVDTCLDYLEEVPTSFV
jgi:hypothetical protein